MQSNRLAISDYDVILTALGGEYKAEHKFCQSFIVKYTNIQVLMTLKARKDLMVFKQRNLL